MGEPRKAKPIEIWTLVVTAITSISVAIGGVFGYLYVDQWFVEEIKSRTSVNKIEVTLKEMERDVKAIKEDLLVLEKKANVSLDLSRFVVELQPNLSITQKKWSYKNKTLIFTYEIINHGPHTVIVDRPIVHLSYVQQYPENDPDNSLDPDSYRVDAIDLGWLSAASRPEVFSVEITFGDEPNSKILYSTIVFTTRTPPVLERLAKRLLEGLLSEEEIRLLTRRDYLRYATNTLDKER